MGDRVKTVVQNSQRFMGEEMEEGFRPSDPSGVIERVQQLEVSKVVEFECYWPLRR